MRPVEIRPFGRPRRDPTHSFAGALIVALLLVAIVVAGFAFIEQLARLQ